MKLADVQKGSKQEGVVMAFRTTRENYDYIKKNNINLRLMVETLLDEFRKNARGRTK